MSNVRSTRRLNNVVTNTWIRSLNLAPEKSEVAGILNTIDPLNSGFVPFVPFLSYAAIMMNSKDDDEDEENEEDEDGHEVYDVEEVRAAYRLFTHGGPGPITLAHLRRVAKELREDVPDELLKDMIREANGGDKSMANPGGVGLEEFENVMKRAGLTFG